VYGETKCYNVIGKVSYPAKEAIQIKDASVASNFAFVANI